MRPENPPPGRSAVAVAVIALVALCWAIWHLWSVTAHPWDGPEAAYMIWPLVLCLAAMTPFVILSALGQSGRRLAPDMPGLTEGRRARFVLGCAIFVAMIFGGGLLAAALLAAPALAALLGERRPLALALVAALPALILTVGFVWLLDLRLPLGPLWL